MLLALQPDSTAMSIKNPSKVFKVFMALSHDFRTSWILSFSSLQVNLKRFLRFRIRPEIILGFRISDAFIPVDQFLLVHFRFISIIALFSVLPFCYENNYTTYHKNHIS